MQSIVEILFFYHPAVWWMSANIRHERENSCDDLAISLTGETNQYAKTLILLQEQRVRELVPAMAFTGNKFKFTHRIKRLFNQPTLFADFKEGFITAIILIVGVCALSINTLGFSNAKGNIAGAFVSEVLEIDEFLL